MSEIETPWWAGAFLSVYFGVALVLFGYGMHAYFLAWLFGRVRDREPVAPANPRTLPPVTVQLPVFNERYVARRLIDAVAALDYPRDRLQIQVLDDSTDDTAEHVAGIVAEWRARGTDIVHRRRANRAGFKAGALREGLTDATGDLVAVFDADFVPPAGFLRDTLPYFADPRVGMVQTCWGHLNEDYSLLTRAQAVALDGHFRVEQTVRNRSGAFMNFNGTAGIWRRACIVDAGNWSHDTLTEDLDLSYRAQLRGWKFVFLPEVVSPAELPSEVNGLKGQQFRWAKGSVQTAVKLLPRILSSPLTGFQKLQAVVHLTSHVVYPLLLLLGLAILPALMILDRYPGVEPVFTAATVLVVASFGHPALYFLAQRLRGKRWSESIPFLPVVLACGMGIAINNTRAFLGGLFGSKGEFNRTPKYAIERRGDSWRDKRYRHRPSPWALVELALALYTGVTLVYALRNEHFLVTPFVLLYFAGAAYIGGLSLLHAVARLREGRAEAGVTAARMAPSPTGRD